ncbi:MAG: hypothetical protein IT577_04910, partial [Verrucomicrobiae bacterium]|nr:hypothetical protein [Verrucomicrobiae bacterium]
HNPSGPVANAATLQIAACTPNFYLLETMASDVPHRREVSTESVRFESGQMIIPDAPGLGIDIREAEISKHPYEPRDLRHYTGALTQIRPPDATSYFEAGAQVKDRAADIPVHQPPRAGMPAPRKKAQP